MMRHQRTLLLCLGLFATFPAAVRADLIYVEKNLVSSVQGMAPNFDPNLQNPWGVSFSATSPFWVSNQITGNSTLYNASGVPQSLVVTIPGGNPTGQVFNSTASDFALPVGGKAAFIFATLDGTIAGWNGGSGTTAQIAATENGASYTGLALANNGTGNFLYAANDGQGKIDVFNSTFHLTTLAGSFTDPNLPTGYTPYNIQNLGGKLYVAYENSNGDGGAVDVFDTNGNFLQRISSNAAGGPLSHPWGMALAPAGFGKFGGDLLVGNEGTGAIDAFNPTTGHFDGAMQIFDANGNPFNIGFGLWALNFGIGGSNGNPNTLYFAAGINNETGGLLGAIAAIPEPSTFALLVVGAIPAGIVVHLRRRARSRA
jgi:uncharacterized protein (TIGR03118 family)